MPWDSRSFAKHNRSLTSGQSAHAARIANAILQRTGKEGLAIATANKLVKRDEGGIVGPQDIETQQQATPAYQGMLSRYSSMPEERLRELSVMLRGSPQAQVIQNVLREKEAKPAELKRGGKSVKRAVGGGSPVMSASQAVPWWTRTEAYQMNKPGIFLQGSTPGRADKVHTTAPAGAHIIPADVISGSGQGNSLNGAMQWEKILRSGPYGTAPAPMRHGSIGMPSRRGSAQHLAKGGGDSQTPVALSDGELLVFPHWVAHLGGGDHKKGHKWLNDRIVEERKKHIKTLGKLPGPVKEGT